MKGCLNSFNKFGAYLECSRPAECRPVDGLQAVALECSAGTVLLAAASANFQFLGVGIKKR